MPSGRGIPLAVEHRGQIEPRLAYLREAWSADCPSEYAFANLYLFRAVHDYQYCGGDYPAISGLTYDGARHLLPLFDLASAEPQKIIEALAGHDCYYPVSAATVRRLDPHRFRWDANEADADYLYPIANFLGYRGEPLRGQRAALARLRHEAPKLVASELTSSHIADASYLLAQWLDAKGKTAADADGPACIEALKQLDALGLHGSMYYNSAVPLGFLIAEALGPGTAVIHFAKGVDSPRGVYPYMFHHYAQSRASGLHWLNFEQDLGIPNLRRTKQSYQPARLIRKFRVFPREALA